MNQVVTLQQDAHTCCRQSIVSKLLYRRWQSETE